MAKGGIPVVVVDNGVPAIISNRGMPITIVGGSGGAVVQDDADVPLYLSSGFNAGTGKTQVNDGHLTGVALPAGTAVTNDGATTILSKADDTGLLAMVTVNVDANDEFENVALPQNYAVIQDAVSDMDVLDFGAGGGAVAVVARVAANVGDVQLANATTKIAINAVAITVVDASGKTAGATIAVDQGLWGNFPIIAGTDAIAKNGNAIEIENQGGTQDVAGTLVVAAGVPVARLPANSALVGNNVALQVPVTGTYTNTITPQVNASGVITGFTLS